MRDRLMGLLKCFRTPICEGLSAKLPDVERLVDHLLAGGVIVLPCKVGATVFVTDIIVGSIVECEVVVFEVDEDGVGGMEYRVPEEIPNITSIATLTTEIGKTVFLTREEAEKALAEREV